jgi:hypothetical protein
MFGVHEKKQTKTKNVERHAGGLSKLKYTYSNTPFHHHDTGHWTENHLLPKTPPNPNRFMSYFIDQDRMN